MTVPTTTTRRLAEVASSPGTTIAVGPTGGSPDSDAVVLSRTDAATIEVAAGGDLHRIPDATAVTEITDPSRRLTLITGCLFPLFLFGLGLAAVLSIPFVTAALNLEVPWDRARRELGHRHREQRDRHTRTLDRIRGYAIARHHDGLYCLDGLNEFLRTFSLPGHATRIRVGFTIRGSYETGCTDTKTARYDAAHLDVDLSEVSDLIEGGSDVTVEVDSVEVLDG